jgi:hypothetical protein
MLDDVLLSVICHWYAQEKKNSVPLGKEYDSRPECIHT